jgi:hypothetical protein
MTRRSVDATAAALGRPVAILATAGAALGAIAVVVGLLLGRSVATFAALDAAFLYFAGIATGSVALAAAVRIVAGGWARPILPIALAGEAFFGPGLVLLVLLALGARAFIPWTAGSGPAGLAGLWTRLLAPSAVLFALGWRFVALARAPRSSDGAVRAAAVLYVIAYTVALSFWAYDLVMAIAGGPPATVVPAFYFFGAFLSGFAWIALVTAVRSVSGPDLRHDVGKLLFGFIVVWAYLLWSLFLPAWYGNIPEESAQLLARWRGSYKPVTEAVLVAVFLWPFWLLFPETMKRRRETLALGAATVLLGLGAERFLLVFPSLEVSGGTLTFAIAIGIACGMTGLFLLTVGARIGAAQAADPTQQWSETGLGPAA